jgi:hypothetical protein
MLYLALGIDGRIYNLCDCGDIEAADESAKDLDISAVWLWDAADAKTVADEINRHLKDSPSTARPDSRLTSQHLVDYMIDDKQYEVYVSRTDEGADSYELLLFNGEDLITIGDDISTFPSWDEAARLVRGK